VNPSVPPSATTPEPVPPWQQAAARTAASAAWPAASRAGALARLDANGLPDGSQEDWRYTSLDAFRERWSAYLAAGETTPRAATPARPAPPGTVHLELVDGRLAPLGGELPPGLVAGSLARLPAESRARARALLDRADALAPDPLVDLNTALATDVLVVATEPGGDLGDRPVHIDVRGPGGAVFAQPRILVDVAPGSRLVLGIEYSGGDGVLANAVLQAWVGPGGRFTLVRAGNLPDDGLLTDTARVELAAGATAEIFSAELGAAVSRYGLTVALAGARSSATVAGLFVADGRRHLDTRTLVEHRAPGTTSREHVRGLADGAGKGVFNGRIIVLPGAAGSDAALSNRNLLLAATAEVDTKPELEIYVDDVRCSHGATTGQLDASALFYLRSRGLDPATARELLTGAFLREPLAALSAGPLRDRLEARLRDRLAAGLAPSGAGP
jgi:Fe-S cluster assembly protein SufD